MAHRTCGIVYYANDLTVITKTGERVNIERTEAMLVRENDQLEAGGTTTKEWIAVIPVDRNDSADEVTDLEWLKTATETERTAVRFVRVDASPHEMRLMQARPPTWGDTPGSLAYRSFPVRDIPLTILKSHTRDWSVLIRDMDVSRLMTLLSLSRSQSTSTLLCNCRG